jgi:hypothetical protein
VLRRAGAARRYRPSSVPRPPVRLTIVACTLAALAGAAGTAGATRPGLRVWHGLLIRPLDAPPLRARAASATPAEKRHADEVLSDERTYARSAYSLAVAAVRRRPTLDADRLASTRLYTEDGFSEIYLALRTHWDPTGREWVKIRIPGRPNGRVGWVRRDALGSWRLTHRLIEVDRRHLRLTLLRNGRRVWSAPVGIGKPGTPTPGGHFWIRERFKIASPRSGYYPYAFGTADYSTLSDWPGGGIVGIHGPYYAPSAIPGRISHGCIRLGVRADAWLARHITVGVPLRVR